MNLDYFKKIRILDDIYRNEIVKLLVLNCIKNHTKILKWSIARQNLNDNPEITPTGTF